MPSPSPKRRYAAKPLPPLPAPPAQEKPAHEDGEKAPSSFALQIVNEALRKRGEKPLPQNATFAPLVSDASGLPIDSDAPQRRRDAKPLSDAVGRVLHGLEVKLGARPEEKIFAAWPEVAGPELASRLVPVRFENGLFFVAARSDAEVFEIRRRHQRALDARARRNPAFAAVRQIRIVCERYECKRSTK